MACIDYKFWFKKKQYSKGLLIISDIFGEARDIEKTTEHQILP